MAKKAGKNIKRKALFVRITNESTPEEQVKALKALNVLLAEGWQPDSQGVSVTYTGDDTRIFMLLARKEKNGQTEELRG